MARMAFAEALRNQGLNRLADELSLRVTEQLGRARVCSANDPVAIRDKDGVWRHLEQVLERELSKLGLILWGPNRSFPIRGIKWEHVLFPANGNYAVLSVRATPQLSERPILRLNSELPFIIFLE
jgi:hypothetical protein